jgi:sugar phosphate permease
VARYAVIYASLKVVYYGILLWMPLYLSSVMGFGGKVTGVLASMFDVGGLLGGIAVGHISDRLSSRTYILTPLVTLGVPLLLAFLLVDAHTSFLFFLIIPLLGVAISSPTNLVASMIPSDLAQRTEIEGNRRVLGTITGIIVGTGTIWAGLGMLVIGWLQDVSWTYVFSFLLGNGVLAAVLLAVETRKAHREVIRSRKSSLGLELEETDLN